MEIVIMLFNYLNYRLAALSTEVDEAYFNNKTGKYILKIRKKNAKYQNRYKLEIDQIPEIISVNIKNIYLAPNYLKNNNIYNDTHINSSTIWGFVDIENKLIPLVRLEYLLLEVFCETYKS